MYPVSSFERLLNQFRHHQVAVATFDARKYVSPELELRKLLHALMLCEQSLQYAMTECAKLFGPLKCTDTRYLADDLVGFEAEPSCGRGTTGIIWNCLVVMTFCAWSVIHLDTKPWSVPASVRRRTKGKFWSKVLNVDRGTELRVPSSFDIIARKTFEALVLILYPEYGVLIAIEELSIARRIHHTTQKVYGWESFSLKQAHLVRMGGVHIPQLERPEDFHLFVARSAPMLEYDRFPSEAAIDLRAKRDVMDKVLASFQALYFICNIAVRNHRGYRLAELELLTLTYIAYSSINFLIRIKKPQELYEAFELEMVEFTALPGSNGNESINSPHPRLEKWTWIAMAAAIIAINLMPLAILRRKNSFSLGSENRDPEKFLVLAALVGFAATLMFMLWRQLRSRQWKRDTPLKKALYYSGFILVYAAGLCYLGFRTYLLGAVLMDFNATPAGVYLTSPSWTQYLGHVGS